MITWTLIAVTVIVSYLAFQNPELTRKLQFNAAHIVHGRQYYRLVSHAFIHSGWTHLGVNMLVLYFFGRNLEGYFNYWFGKAGTLYFLLLYLGGILASNIWGLIKHKNNYYYNALGASGAVSAILFAFIFFNPWEKLYLFAIVPIPGIVFAVGYLIYSYQMSKRSNDNIAHDAHLLGALFGFCFPIILNTDLLRNFLDQLFSVL